MNINKNNNMNIKLPNILLALLISINIIYAQQKNEIDSTIIKENIRNIHSIETTSNNSDLLFLNDELEDVEILMLGEQSHGDGSTFLAKTRLIKYLHEKLNYNVLVFESGLMDVYRVWKMIQNGESNIDVFNHGIFPIWANSKQTEELFTYILEQSKTENPIYLAGFDMQPTGSLVTPEKRWNEISIYLKQTIDFKEEEYPLFTKVFKKISVIFSTEFTNDNLRSLTNEFQKLYQLVAQKDKSKKGKITARYIDNYLKTIALYKKADLKTPPNTPHVFNIRDNEMAKNFRFLKEEIYPDEKFIVWGANSHLGYGRGFLEDFLEIKASAKGMIPMGQYLKVEYQEKLYTLAFTSSAGSIGSFNSTVRDLPPAHELTLESKIVKLGFENAYLSMKNSNIKSLQFATRIFGHGTMNGKWGQMCDGIFFIKTMIPNERRK